MNRVCIFAHYDKDNIIDDYVIYYLNALKKDFNKIIFVSDSDLPKEQTEKLSSICDYVQAYHHGEYDWGSYKFGYIIAKQNNLLVDADELLLCNDSVYGPVSSLRLEKMQADFNGYYENKFGLDKGVEEPHLQSWFLLVKKQMFNTPAFDSFLMSITKFEDKLDIIRNYEIGFTKSFAQDFSYSALYSSNLSDSITNAPIQMLENGFPFIKTRILRKYNINKYLKQNLDEALYNSIQKHSSRFEKPSIFKVLYNNLKLKNKSKKYIIKHL